MTSLRSPDVTASNDDVTPRNKLPLWTSVWLLVSAVVCTWDASFIILRPHSLPGGKYHSFWKPYAIYIEVDKRYKDMADPFVYAQSLMNYVEIFLCFLALILSARNAGSAAAVAVCESVMTSWKTVLYLLQYTELCGGGAYHAHNDALTSFLYLYLPSGIWIVLPVAVVARLWGRIAQGKGAGGRRGRGENGPAEGAGRIGDVQRGKYKKNK